MPRGKRAHADPPVEWKITLPTSIAAEVELRLTDPLLGKPKYGARRDLVVRLLQEWLAQQRK